MLVALDFDRTLSRVDPYVRLAEQNGTSDEVAALLDQVAAGDLGFERGLRSAVDHLEGLREDDVEDALTAVRVDPAAADLVSSLQAADHHVAVVSDAPERAIRSCFTPDEFVPDSVVANTLQQADGALTGAVRGPPLGGTKAECLDVLATREGVSLSEAVAVGGDRRDLPMLQAAGNGIAVDPTPLVESEADRAFPSVERAREWFEHEDVV